MMNKSLSVNTSYYLPIVFCLILLGCGGEEPESNENADANVSPQAKTNITPDTGDVNIPAAGDNTTPTPDNNTPIITDDNIPPITDANTPSIINASPIVSAGVDSVYNQEVKAFLLGEASDPDGNITSTSWFQLQGPKIIITNDKSLNAEFTTPTVAEAEVLIFELTATDNLGEKSSSTVNVTVKPENIPPLVNVGSDFDATDGNTVILSGEVSDKDGEIVTATWTQLEGTKVDINDAYSAHTTFVAPILSSNAQSQVLVFELSVTDDSGAVSTDSVSITITAPSDFPIALAGEDQTYAPYSEVTLNCNQSYDPKGSALNILWVQTTNGSITIDDNFSCLTTFKLPPTAGVFEFALTVTNEEGRSSTDFITITSDLNKLPLLTIDNFEYQGGFRVTSENFGETQKSTLSYSPGVIAYNPVNNSLFSVSHPWEQAIVEFAIPEIVNSRDMADFKIQENIIQHSGVFHQSERVDTGIDQRFLITGLNLIEEKLVVNYMDWYDTSGDPDTTVIFQDVSNLSSAEITGPFQIAGTNHAAGWITPIPEESQDRLGGRYISGFSSGSVLSRLSVGPSGFIYKDADSILNAESGIEIENVALLDFDYPQNILYNKAIYGDGDINPDDILYNTDFKNDLWTRNSGASHGFIVPGSNTYVTLGFSSGHEFGLGYKAIQEDGYQCGGPCAFISTDKYNYYWLWHVNDLVKVKQGILEAHDVRPYEYGILDTPSNNELKGAAYDADTGLLYVSVKDGDDYTTKYGRPPIFYVYKIKND